MPCKSILVVEDHEDIRFGLQRLLEGEGYPVLLAADGQAALDLLAMKSTPKPGLILLDLTMPVMDGPAFLLELKRSHPKMFAHTPIYIMTARADIHRLTFKTTGVLKKPFDVDELCRVAKQYCDPTG